MNATAPEPEKAEPFRVSGDDRAADLEWAAIELLRERGVLAGLNLREVAERAGVARTLLYYHFGSQQDLLRAAIARIHRDLIGKFRFGRDAVRLGTRARRNFELVVDNDLPMRLIALLELDGAGVKLLPNLENRLDTLESDQRAGRIRDDVDPKHILAAIVSVSIGYSLFRERMSEEMWAPLGELDTGVADLVERMFDSLHGDADGEEPDG